MSVDTIERNGCDEYIKFFTLQVVLISHQTIEYIYKDFPSLPPLLPRSFLRKHFIC